jgi:lipoprotein-releasing system permease protein
VKLRTVLFIAKRLLISRQKKTAVSVISWIAVLGMLVSAAAMVILLSAFNGIEGMIEGLYTEFDQEIIVRPRESKKIHPDSLKQLVSFSEQLQGVERTSLFIQERIILRKKKKWANAELWAVEPSFNQMAKLYTREHLINGRATENENQSLIGVGLANKLGLRSMDLTPESVVLYIPRQDRKIRIGKSPFFQQNIAVVGAMDYNKEVNDQILLVSLSFAKGYFNDEVSGLLIQTEINQRSVVNNILNNKFGKQFTIKTNLEKNELIFKTSKSEKLIVVIILIFVFILSLFNLSASLTMTFLEKKAQLNTMYSLGLSSVDVKRVFIVLGLIIVGFGVFIGLGLGSLLVFLHEQLHLITIPGTLNAFPSKFDVLQVLSLLFLLISLGFVATFITTSFLIKSREKA